VLEYLGDWDQKTMSAYAGEIPATRPEPVIVDGNELGPFCTIEFPGSRRSVAVRALPATVEAIRPRIVTPDDHLSFRIVGHKGTGRALVVAEHGYIIGSHWLAYIDPATIPMPWDETDG
jgi:hypothetical protein